MTDLNGACPYCFTHSIHPNWCPTIAGDSLADADWIADGACASMPPAMFTDEIEHNKRPSITVLHACASCPVRRLCLEWSVRTNQDVGVWAGTTPKDRRRMRCNGLGEERITEHFRVLEETVTEALRGIAVEVRL